MLDCPQTSPAEGLYAANISEVNIGYLSDFIQSATFYDQPSDSGESLTNQELFFDSLVSQYLLDSLPHSNLFHRDKLSFIPVFFWHLDFP